MSLTPKQHTNGFQKLVAEAKTGVRAISLAEYKEMLAQGEAVVLIDVREESEWAAGRATTAIHLGKGIIERDIEKAVPDPATRMVLYCGGGYRSVLAAEALQKMGYTDVISLDGGWRAWNEGDMPIDK